MMIEKCCPCYTDGVANYNYNLSRLGVIVHRAATLVSII